MKVLNKEEKLTILLTLLIAILLVVTGLLSKTLRPGFKYNSTVSNNNNTNVSKEVEVLENIAFEVNEEIDQDVAKYLKGESDVLKQTVLDFSQVDHSKIGTYTVTGKVQDKKIEFPVKVVDTKAPVIKAAKNNFTWYLEAGETVEDVKDFVKVSVTDNYDTDLEVNDWIKELPEKEGQVKYPISAEDSSGNQATFEVVITYQFLVEEPETPVVPDEPEQPNSEPEEKY